MLEVLEHAPSLRILEFEGHISPGDSAETTHRVVSSRQLQHLELNTSTIDQAILRRHYQVPKTCRLVSLVAWGSSDNWQDVLHPSVLSHIHLDDVVHVRVHPFRLDFWVHDVPHICLTLRSRHESFCREDVMKLKDYLREHRDGRATTSGEPLDALRSTQMTVYECRCSLSTYGGDAYLDAACSMTGAALGCPLCALDDRRRTA